MNHYILFYKTIKGYIEKRAPFRKEHLEIVTKAHTDGILVMGGALENPSGEALLIFQCDNPSIVEKFAKNDPYVINGIVKNWNIRTWNIAIGGKL